MYKISITIYVGLITALFCVSSNAETVPVKTPEGRPGCQISSDFKLEASAKDAALKQWAQQQSDKLKGEDPSASFNYMGYIHGDLKDLAQIKHQLRNKCLLGYWVFDFQLNLSECRYEVSKAEAYAENCCQADVCPNRSPAGWTLELFHRSDPRETASYSAKNLNADELRSLLNLIDPKVGARYTDQSGNQQIYFRKQGQRAAQGILSGWTPEIDSLECDAEFKDGKAKCRVSRSGSANEYQWQLSPTNPAEAFLRTIVSMDTGE